MTIIANVWENLYYGIIGKKQLPAGYRTIKTWNIGEKIISGQLHNKKTFKNGNTQQRIITLYNDCSLGLETRVTNPDGELLKAYAGIRTTSGTKPIITNPHVNIFDNDVQIQAAKNMHAIKNIKDAKTLE